MPNKECSHNVEDHEDIQWVCTDCMNKRKAEVQEMLKLMQLEAGDFIKMPFDCGDQNEYMWVKVLDVTGHTGELSSEPIFCKNYHFGDVVFYKNEDICDFMREPNG